MVERINFSVLSVIASGLVFLAGLTGAGQAHADIDEFAAYGAPGDMSSVALLSEIEHTADYNGITLSNFNEQSVTDMAIRICNQRAMGANQRYLFNLIRDDMVHPNFGVAIAEVNGAEFHFCPAYNPTTANDPRYRQ